MVLSLGKYLQIQKKYSTEKSFIVQHTVSCFTQLTLRYVYVRKKIRFCADFSNYRESTAERERMNFSKCQTGTTMNCQNDYGKTKTEHTHTHNERDDITNRHTNEHEHAYYRIDCGLYLHIASYWLYIFIHVRTNHTTRREEKKKKKKTPKCLKLVCVRAQCVVKRKAAAAAARREKKKKTHSTQNIMNEQLAFS